MIASPWREIAADRALSLFGACIAGGHLLAALYWTVSEPLVRLLGPRSTPVCWPLFPRCAEVHTWPSWLLGGLLVLYALTAGLSAAAFLTRRISLGWWSLLLVCLANAAWVALDYRLRLNQHLMLLWVGVTFLLVPGKRLVVRSLVVAFYFWAGLLKLNTEWLSGEALSGRMPLLVPRTLVTAACAYVVLLELVLVLGLLSRQRWVLAATLGQLGLFHLTSFSIVGFFYPLLMALLLAVFPLSHVIPEPPRRSEGRRWPALGVLSVFSALQLVPHLLPGDPVLTGRGRGLALHMFDAPVACRAVATMHHEGMPPSPMAMTARLPLRIACDPLVYWSFAAEICRQKEGDPTFLDLDLLLESRRGSGGALVRVVDVPRFCSETPPYEVFGGNPWIRGE